MRLRRGVARGRSGQELLDQQVRIGTARAERGHRRHARRRRAVGAASRRPRLQRALHRERRAGEVDVRIEPLRVQRRHQGRVLELQQHLGQAGDAGRAFAVADVGLDRTDPDRTRFERGRFARVRLARLGRARCRLGALVQGAGQPGDLDRVAQRGAGAVRLDVADRGGVDAAALQGAADQARLRRGVGHREAVGAAAVVDALPLSTA
nr:hypothetical protein [Lysobacter enzymogenes]